MERSEKRRASWWIFIPLCCIAILFQVSALPEAADQARPDLLLLVIIFFASFDPGRVSLELAWLCGFILDLMLGAPLGVNALMEALCLYLIISQFQRFAIFIWWQQAVVIGICAFISRTVSYWLAHLISNTNYEVSLWQPALTTLALWPLVRILCIALCRLINAVPAGAENPHA